MSDRSARGKRVGVAAAVILTSVIGAAAVVLFGPPTATAFTGRDSGFLPHAYDMPVDQTAEVAGAVAATALKWRVGDRNVEKGMVTLYAPSRLGLSQDTVSVHVRPSGKFALVDIVSTSGGRGLDFGASAQHLRDLQEAMDRQLPLGN